MNMDVDWEYLLFSPSLLSLFAWVSLVITAIYLGAHFLSWWHKWKYIIGTIQRAHRKLGVVKLIDVIPVSEKWMQEIDQMLDNYDKKEAEKK